MTHRPIGPAGRGPRTVQTTTPVPEPPSMREAKKQVASGDGPGQDRYGVNGVEKAHTFDLDFTDQRGRRWTGRFRTHVLTYREKIQVGLMRAKLAGDVPPHMLDLLTGQLLEMLAHLSVALDSAPEWAAKLEDLHDPAVVSAIYREVAAHESRFHGADAGRDRQGEDSEPGGTGGAGVDDEGRASAS